MVCLRNILIKSYSRCEVKVIDFGSSCYVDDSLTNYVQSRSYRPANGLDAGLRSLKAFISPVRAPEVLLGLAYDQKIDLWQLVDELDAF